MYGEVQEEEDDEENEGEEAMIDATLHANVSDFPTICQKFKKLIIYFVGFFQRIWWFPFKLMINF